MKKMNCQIVFPFLGAIGGSSALAALAVNSSGK
jgi:hypothetical protein